jgi:hypothetical protein
VSEYQRYEFQAIDRPLTAQEQSSLRRYSSRAVISASRFVVDYSWGSFKGDVAAWMEKYFDAFLYLANWGTHELFLRLPTKLLTPETAKRYCVGESASARRKGGHVILEFRSEDEEGSEWIDEGDAPLASLLPVRAELAGGDLRALYLAWLGCVQAGELEKDAVEPPCPPGLGKLSPALEELAAFLRVDGDLIAAAATASQDLDTHDDTGLEAWVSTLPEAERISLLVRLVSGAEPHLPGELLRRFRASRSRVEAPVKITARSVGELLEAAEARAEQRRSKEAERAAREKARQERKTAEARERHLAALAGREAAAWSEVDKLIATRQPKAYDEAVALLHDLRDVCARAGRQVEAATRIARLRDEHAKKPRLLERLRKAGLTP